jgi:hypothetical protein
MSFLPLIKPINNLISIGVFLFFVSCLETGTHENNNLEIIDSSAVKLDYLYYEDGKTLKCVTEMLGEVKHGKCVHFYESGETLGVFNYVNGNLEGEGRFYYPDGQLECVMEYGNYFDSLFSRINTRIYYDNLGNIIEESSFDYVYLNAQKEPYRFNEQAHLDVEFLYPRYDSLFASTGAVDEKFNLIEGKVHYYDGENSVVRIPLRTDSLGRHFLRFTLTNYEPIEPDSLGNIYIFRKIFCEYEYRVE